ncbi:zinc-binding dehydrogenase [Streptomyces bambusae]|uniref:zinc-binding dehydrogenase n=1 Tax=Streptomyces bambusae TaxID=1550616 RepID=UPI0027E16856|nr:zinc-binding dehydrogenase [Streptomyces bambusae]
MRTACGSSSTSSRRPRPTPAGFADLVDRAGIRPFVEETLALTEAARAHRLIESGRVRSKIVLVP